jgi:hypothetical protein
MRASLRQVLFRSAGLDLNFSGGVFSLNNTRTASPAAIPGWSFSRTDTNGIATALDLAGNVIQFATGVPRITNRGILVEEARTNLLLNSATLSTQTVTTTAVAHTLSFYGTGTVTLTGTSTAGPLVGTGANNRVTLTFTPIVGPLLLTVTGSVTMAQVEIGAFATSPIITTGAAGTRGADVAVVGSLAFSQPFTIAGEWDLPLAASVTAQNIANWTNATGFLRRIRAGLLTTAFQLNNDSNVNDVNITAAGPTAAGVGRAALRAQTNNAAPAFNGTLLGSDTSCDIATMTILRVGSNGATEPLNGYVRRVQVLPFAATDAQLQALTAP